MLPYFLGGLATSQELMRRVLAHALHVFRVIDTNSLAMEVSEILTTCYSWG